MENNINRVAAEDIISKVAVGTIDTVVYFGRSQVTEDSRGSSVLWISSRLAFTVRKSKNPALGRVREGSLLNWADQRCPFAPYFARRVIHARDRIFTIASGDFGAAFFLAGRSSGPSSIPLLSGLWSCANVVSQPHVMQRQRSSFDSVMRAAQERIQVDSRTCGRT
jgi:hypothetical protein